MKITYHPLFTGLDALQIAMHGQQFPGRSRGLQVGKPTPAAASTIVAFGAPDSSRS